MKKHTILFAVSFALVSCGGGGGNDTPSPPPAPLSISLSATSVSIEAVEGRNDVSFSFDAVKSGSTSSAVFADVQFDTNLLRLEALPVEVTGKYSPKFFVRSDLGDGIYKGEITFRLCTDAACTSIHPNTTHKLPFEVKVRLDDWHGLQRTAKHDGYINTAYDYTRFTKAWEWTPPVANNVSSVVTGDNAVFTMGLDRKVYALRETDGSQIWTYNHTVGNQAYAPAYTNGKVLISLRNNGGESEVTEIDAKTGEKIKTLIKAETYSGLGTPVVDGDKAYFSQGRSSGELYAYDSAKGEISWFAQTTNPMIYTQNMVAVSGDEIYLYDGHSLNVLDKSNGSIRRKILESPSGPSWSSYYAAPVVMGDGNIVTYSGMETYWFLGRPLSHFNLKSGTIDWRTNDKYSGQPATAKGVIYAGNDTTRRVDALDGVTGQTLWSWTPPPLPASPFPNPYYGAYFTRNLIVTNNLLFVSTYRATYAIDLSTRAMVWSYPASGELAISANNYLYISSENISGRPEVENAGKLIAIKLK